LTFFAALYSYLGKRRSKDVFTPKAEKKLAILQQQLLESEKARQEKEALRLKRQIESEIEALKSDLFAAAGRPEKIAELLKKCAGIQDQLTQKMAKIKLAPISVTRKDQTIITFGPGQIYHFQDPVKATAEGVYLGLIELNEHAIFGCVVERHRDMAEPGKFIYGIFFWRSSYFEGVIRDSLDSFEGVGERNAAWLETDDTEYVTELQAQGAIPVPAVAKAASAAPPTQKRKVS